MYDYIFHISSYLTDMDRFILVMYALCHTVIKCHVQIKNLGHIFLRHVTWTVRLFSYPIVIVGIIAMFCQYIHSNPSDAPPLLFVPLHSLQLFSW